MMTLSNPAGNMTRRSFVQISAFTSSVLLSGMAASTSESVKKINMYRNLGCGHIGVNANLRESIEYAAKFGFQGVNANIGELEKMEESQRRELVDFMKEKGIRFGVSGLPVEFRRDEEQFHKDLALFPPRARILKSVGVDRITTWLLPGDNQLTYLQHFEQNRRRLTEAAQIMYDEGIRFGLEFVGPKTTRNRFRYPFAYTQREMMELADAIGTGNVGLLLDAWHWHTSHGTIEEIRELTNHDIVEVHVNDAPAGVATDELVDNRRELPTATGVIDLKGFMNVLAAMEYDGPVTVEPFNQELSKMDNEPALQKTIEALNRAFDLIGA
ncbi:MAG: sugar phosphate isomerase/epimerase [Candidatus Omnitrophota bacterium]|nr:MAG: sugar phosphate isomerase/epimerase [Candidatus Omnitrophota bacterium]